MPDQGPNSSSTQCDPTSAGHRFFDLRGKRCVVTGAAAGIGKAIAMRYVQAGAQVCLTDIDAQAIEKTTQQIKQLNETIQSSVLDVGSADACNAFAEEIKSRWPDGMDVLVNNAGIGFKGTLDETSLMDFQKLNRVNVEGVINLTKALLPLIRLRGSGTIINTASIGGIVGLRDRVAYCSTKFAVVGITKSMALDHADENIRVNCICPGRVHTPFVDSIIQSYDDPEAAYQAMSATQPIGRMARPDEIAAGAHYLASDDASFITGTSLYIDGGFSAGK